MDTLGHRLALRVTPADVQDRAQAGALAKAVQTATGDNVELAYVDRGYTGETPAAAVARHGVKLHVVKLSSAKRGVVIPRDAAAPQGRRTQFRLACTLPPPRARL